MKPKWELTSSHRFALRWNRCMSYLMTLRRLFEDMPPLSAVGKLRMGHANCLLRWQQTPLTNSQICVGLRSMRVLTACRVSKLGHPQQGLVCVHCYVVTAQRVGCAL